MFITRVPWFRLSTWAFGQAQEVTWFLTTRLIERQIGPQCSVVVHSSSIKIVEIYIYNDKATN